MEKQPNSRMCFVCGIENPIGLKLAFYTDDQGRRIAHLQPRREQQGYPGQLHAALSARCWTSQPRFVHPYAFSLYDSV